MEENTPNCSLPFEAEAKPERPLECSECRKPVAVKYTEVVSGKVTHMIMCADCPVLHWKLQGPSPLKKTKDLETAGAGLCCGTCGTKMEAIQRGSLVGCEACYDLFDEVILSELRDTKKAPPRLFAKTKKSETLHVGRSPGESIEVSPTLRLVALNEALSETLKQEDYEQAAWIRDQIKSITEKENDGKK